MMYLAATVLPAPDSPLCKDNERKHFVYYLCCLVQGSVSGNGRVMVGGSNPCQAPEGSLLGVH